MPKISPTEPCDLKDLAARLAAKPKILSKVVEMLELVENAEGDLRRADEAERRVTEILRGTGHEILTGWAEQVAEVVTNEVQSAEPVVGHAKKSSLVYDLRSDNGRGSVLSSQRDEAVASSFFKGCRCPLPRLFSAPGAGSG